MFWNSVKIMVGALAGGLLVGMPAAWDLPNLIFKEKIYCLYCTDDDAVFVMLRQLSGVDKIGLDSLLGIIFRRFFLYSHIYYVPRFSKGFSGVSGSGKT